ncbi:hypothetical protein EUX98_g1013 [Antrodiella citrinella]|uniref:Phytanoyl-CoA dioxygenase n=1 Tax=Antrodiella citrinella TaxID=2447956 RepID=A0A4S4N2L6_9APHY|nr:hypothetical protein EUX98_g1013 [Antrodiella citrinella]
MEAYQTLYDTQGYVLIPPSVLLPTSSPLFQDLLTASAHVVAKTRSGAWSHRRTVGKQFPPFDSDNPDSWGVQHVMHPDLGEDALVFQRWYTGEEVRRVVCALMRCRDEDLQMELFNLLINPESHEFALRWHRDDVREDATTEEEEKALGIWTHGVQWNTALYEDDCLYVVPGSHKVPRTPEQRVHSSSPDPPKDPLAMPGSIKVTLQPGETVFYNSNIVHCGTYTHTRPRATLHACIGSTQGGASRARNILQHGLAWMEDSQAFREGLSEQGRAMLDRTIGMKRGVGEGVGFSQTN